LAVSARRARVDGPRHLGIVARTEGRASIGKNGCLMATGSPRKEALLEAGLIMSSQLSLPVVLQRIVDLATQVADARYGALGVLGPDGSITEFVTSGLSASDRKTIGDLPTGHGVLGVLINEPSPLRLRAISDDPRSVGFPPHHPPMRSFLGAPVKALGRVFGNIYLTEKQGADQFTAEDEADLVALAVYAGVAISNAELFQETHRQAVRLQAMREITATILAGTESESVLRLVAHHARELVEADLAAIVSPSGNDGGLAITAAVGRNADELLGMEVPSDASISGDVIRTAHSLVIADASSDSRAFQPMVQAGDMGPAIFVPLNAGGRSLGTLTVANAIGGRRFDQAAVDLVELFADQASVALEYGRAESELQRLMVMDDRERIAKDLHDGVIQSLFAVGMSLQATVAMVEAEVPAHRIEAAVERIDGAITDLRNYIFGLRPGILADRHLDQALRDLAVDFQERTSIPLEVTLDPSVTARLAGRSAGVVQLAREALSNVARHAQASSTRLSLGAEANTAVLTVEDDGQGFDAASPHIGQGLGNLRSRAAELGGQAEITSAPGRGTTVQVRLPM
jgi:signal transduction histidine kinase